MRNEEGEITGGIELFSENSFRTAIREECEQLRKLALLDPLTELPNRRLLESRIESGFAHLRRDSVPFGILFIDVDHFKRFNDEHGHDVGDLALRMVANTLAHAVRPFDTIARWGGEEFAGVFPHADEASLRTVGARIRILVRHSRVRAPGKMLAVTVSVGGAAVKAGDTVDSLLKRADEMMYRSKQNGRDRVTIAGDKESS